MRVTPKHLILALVLLLLGPGSTWAQELGFGLKAGTLGFGVDGAYSVNEWLSVRGGVGYITSGSLLNNLVPDEIEDVEATSEFPSLSFTLGVDFRIVGPLRVMGGALIQPDDFRAFGDLDAATDIGNGTYFPPGSIDLTLDQRTVTPFLGVGLGQVSSDGFGFFFDLALAFGADGNVVLSASEELTSTPGFNEDLALEEARLNDEWGLFKSVYPIVQIGVSYGFSP